MYKIIRENEFISTQWSGGTTNQMYITPSDATISKRDFLIRKNELSAMRDTVDRLDKRIQLLERKG